MTARPSPLFRFALALFFAGYSVASALDHAALGQWWWVALNVGLLAFWTWLAFGAARDLREAQRVVVSIALTGPADVALKAAVADALRKSDRGRS